MNLPAGQLRWKGLKQTSHQTGQLRKKSLKPKSTLTSLPRRKSLKPQRRLRSPNKPPGRVSAVVTRDQLVGSKVASRAAGPASPSSGAAVRVPDAGPGVDGPVRSSIVRRASTALTSRSARRRWGRVAVDFQQLLQVQQEFSSLILAAALHKKADGDKNL